MEQVFDIDPKLIDELAKSIKTEKDLAALSKHLLKLTVERAMGAELDEHLGYEKHAVEGRKSGNNRNGYSSKTLKGNFGEVDIITPRDRNGTYEPQLIKKGQTRITDFDEQILALYAKGMTTRDIADTFKEMYDADVSHSLISKGPLGSNGTLYPLRLLKSSEILFKRLLLFLIDQFITAGNYLKFIK